MEVHNFCLTQPLKLVCLATEQKALSRAIPSCQQRNFGLILYLQKVRQIEFFLNNLMRNTALQHTDIKKSIFILGLRN